MKHYAIHKFPLIAHGIEQYRPLGKATIIHIGTDPQGQLCAWAKVELGTVSEPFELYTAFTGETVPENWVHVGSTTNGLLVLHIFFLP